MRTLYDAVNVGAGIPDNPELVAGYIDGNYQSFAGLAARFPNAIHVPIAVWPSTNDGIVLDVERGDATPGQAPPWVQNRRAAGVIPTVYCSEGDWPAVRKAFRDQGVDEPYYWVAAYPGPGQVLYNDPLCVAHQWGGDTEGGYDVSVVADVWPGVDPVTPPPPDPPTPIQDDDEVQVIHSTVDPRDGTLHVICVNLEHGVSHRAKNAKTGKWTDWENVGGVVGIPQGAFPNPITVTK